MVTARHRRGRRIASLGIVGVLVVLLSSLAVPSPAGAADSIRVDGRGWGHGRGMGQYGALGYALGAAGTPWTSAQILDHFYGGTTAGTTAPGTRIGVRLLSRDGSSTVVTNAEGSVLVRRPGGAEIAGDSHVRVVVQGTDRLATYEGPSCSGPWRSTGTVAATELRLESVAVVEREFSFGKSTDVAVAGDWNGDGRDTIGVFRSGVWYLRNSNSAGAHDLTFSYGRPGDTPIVGDWNGDGRDTVGVRRGNAYYLRNSNSTGIAELTFGYGKPGDAPATGDWNGDGRDTAGVRRGNAYYLRNSNSTGNADLTFGYGKPADRPVSGDWNGDGRDTVGVLRDDTFYLRDSNSTGPADRTERVSVTGQPLSGAWSGGARSLPGVRAGSDFHLRSAGTGSSPMELCTGASTTAYRGGLRAINFQGAQRTVNDVTLEDYIRGVVPREVPPSWGTLGGGAGMAALEAQAVAARSYAAAENRYPYAQTCDTTSCQVYGGIASENALTDTAISRTADVIRRTSGGAVARTEFSSSTGGHTIGPPLSPFDSVPDAGDSISSNSRHRWSRDLSFAQIGDAFCGGADALDAEVIQRLPEDGFRRAKTVRVSCPAGPRDVTGDQFRSSLGLFSTWFSFSGVGPSTPRHPGIYRPSDRSFHLRNDLSGGSADLTFAFGGFGATPLVGDWNGDGVDTPGVRSGNEFSLRNSNSGGAADLSFSFGKPTDEPVVGDVDGDGRDDIGIRRGDALFFATELPSNAATVSFTVAALQDGDRVVFGDWNGDGVDQIAWLRASTFFVDGNGSFAAPASGIPIVADVIGGQDSVGVVDPGLDWHLLRSPTAGSAVDEFRYGAAGDLPLSGRWRP